jgi:hypothetical protein
MTMINPLDHEFAYDSIVLAGVRSPGKVTLSGHDRKIGWDIKRGSGQSGASMTRTSEDPVEVTCTFYLATREDFDAWPSFDGLIRSTTSGQTPKALDVYHPDLVANGITSVVLSSFGGVVHDGLGGQTVTVKLIEYRPPKPKGGSPNGSKTKKPSNVQPDPNDPNAAALAELAALTAQYKATPWG